MVMIDSAPIHDPESGRPHDVKRGFDMAILSRLRFKQLALVASLAETTNLHESARRMNLSQPGATKLLREIETTLGVTLFNRMPRGMDPTPFGLAVARHARQIIAETVRLKAEVDAMQRGETGAVRVGAIMEAVTGLLAQVFATLEEAGGGPLVNLTVTTSDRLVAALNEGALDLGIGRPVEDVDMGNLRFEPLLPERLSIVGRAGHPLAESRGLALADLQDFGWILQPRPSPMRTAIELAFAQAELPFPTARLETSSVLMTAVTLSRSDLLAVLPASVAAFYAASGLVSEVPVNLRGLMGRYGLLRRNEDAADPAIEAIVRQICLAAGAD